MMIIIIDLFYVLRGLVIPLVLFYISLSFDNDKTGQGVTHVVSHRVGDAPVSRKRDVLIVTNQVGTPFALEEQLELSLLKDVIFQALLIFEHRQANPL